MTKKELTNLLSVLREKASGAYCEMISVAKEDTSHGWEAKVKSGEFGKKELDAHTKIGRLHGKHQAFTEACQEIINLMENITALRSAAVPLRKGE